MSVSMVVLFGGWGTCNEDLWGLGGPLILVYFELAWGKINIISQIFGMEEIYWLLKFVGLKYPSIFSQLVDILIS